VYWSAGTGAHWVTGSIFTAYRTLSYERGPLGYPTSDEIPLSDGAVSRFQRGDVYWSPRTGAHWIGGDLLAAYRTHFFQRGPLGYPTSDPHAVPDGTRVTFEHGSLTLTPGGEVVADGLPAPIQPTTPESTVMPTAPEGASGDSADTPPPARTGTPAGPAGGSDATATTPSGEATATGAAVPPPPGEDEGP
jgi:hypothetical protein